MGDLEPFRQHQLFLMDTEPSLDHCLGFRNRQIWCFSIFCNGISINVNTFITAFFIYSDMLLHIRANTNLLSFRQIMSCYWCVILTFEALCKCCLELDFFFFFSFIYVCLTSIFQSVLYLNILYRYLLLHQYKLVGCIHLPVTTVFGNMLIDLSFLKEP